jgi:tRNA(Ile)-lysidine synthase
MTIRAISEEDPLLRTVTNTIRAHRMLQPGDRVLVGFSGGIDSSALLLCLHALTARYVLTLAAAHLNHGLRGARGGADACHAARIAKDLGIPFVTETHSATAYRRMHRLSLEEAGRELRHRFFQKTASLGGYNRIALGHHRDDDAESLLMRFLRGSGPLGLAGIPPVGGGIGGDIAVIRPLIHLSRSEIRTFVQRSGMPVVEDETNTDRRFLRNRIRHELLPLLVRHYNPNLVKGLSRMAALMREEDAWAGDLALKTLGRLLLADHGTLLVLDRRRLAACHPALQRRILRAAVVRCKGDRRRIGFDALEAARRLAVHGPDKGARDLPDGLVVRARGARLELQRLMRRSGRGRPFRPLPSRTEFVYQIHVPGRYPIPEAGVTMVFARHEPVPEAGVYRSGQQTAFFDMDRLQFPLVVRNFRPGDRLAPLGMQGSQKVKKVFIDRKIARSLRSRIPLLLSGNELIWIAGLRQGRRGRLVPQTKRCLKVDIIGC